MLEPSYVVKDEEVDEIISVILKNNKFKNSQKEVDLVKEYIFSDIKVKELQDIIDSGIIDFPPFK